MKWRKNKNNKWKKETWVRGKGEGKGEGEKDDE